MELTKREQRVVSAFNNCVRHGEYTEDYAVTLIEDNQRYGWMSEAAKETFFDELDKLDEIVNRAYFMSPCEEKDYAADFLWYLWCGPWSPLYGKDKMAFFERYFLEDKELHKERYNAYYTYSETKETCERILTEFGLDKDRGHIINGHVPVRIKNGESPVKAGGKLFVIDGGISKAYQKATGIAGYTLIYDSHSLNLAEHKPFIPGESEHTPTIHLVERLERRANISDTDKGAEIAEKIADLKELLKAYRTGVLKQIIIGRQYWRLKAQKLP